MVATEHHFLRTPDGSVYSSTGVHAYRFWQRYLSAFDEVRVVARVRDVAEAPAGMQRADGERVSFVPVPHYVGPWQYLRQAWKVRRAVRMALRDEDAVILRLGSRIGSILAADLWQSGHPYGVEVVGDPYDVFAPGAVRHPLRPLLRWYFPRLLRQQCRRACAVAYVTEHALQRRYPPAPGAFSTNYSDVELTDEAFVASPRSWGEEKRPTRLVFVGTLAQMYKGPDVLLRAMHLCRARGLEVELTLVGDGKHRDELEAMARALALEGAVRFLGQLPAGAAVREQLDAADLFILPSRTEGLPRAMIEAMARGLPCIGSTVGGIPELLPPEDTVPPGNAEALADKIVEVLGSPERMEAASRRNLQKAREYHEDVLRQRRDVFYQYVREATERWLRRKNGGG